MAQNFLVFLAVLGMISHRGNGVGVKITKFVCNLTDADYGQVDWCILKAESRYVQSVKFRFTVHQIPITEYKVRMQIMKRLNGWKPFLYDITVGCNFTRHLNKLTGYVWQIIANAVNFRGTDCPLNQSIFEAERLDNKYLENAFKVLPIPAGDYGAFTTLTVKNKTRVSFLMGATIY